MKKVLILIFIMFFSQNIIYAEDELIWDYKNDEFIKELIQGKTTATEVEKQKRLDDELSKNLGINLIYTNLAECLKISIVRAKIGDGVFTDVIQAQTLKFLAREALIENVIEYNKAQVQLLFNSGIISVSCVLNGYQVPR